MFLDSKNYEGEDGGNTNLIGENEHQGVDKNNDHLQQQNNTINKYMNQDDEDYNNNNNYEEKESPQQRRQARQRRQEENYKKRLSEMNTFGGQSLQSNTLQGSYQYNQNDQYYQGIDFGSLQSINSTNNFRQPENEESNVIIVGFNENDHLQYDKDDRQQMTEEERIKYAKELQLSEDSDENEELQKHKKRVENNEQINQNIPEDPKITEEINKYKEEMNKYKEENQKLLEQQKKLEDQNAEDKKKLTAKERTLNRQRGKNRRRKTQKEDAKEDEDDEGAETESQSPMKRKERVEENKEDLEEEQEDEEGGQNGQRPPPRRLLIPIARPDPNFKIGNMKEFLTNPLPKGYMFQAQIRREKQGMSKFFPKYHVYMTHGYRYLMSCKKRSGNKTSNYLIGMNQGNLEKSDPGFLGKVRSNFMGTEFNVYDTGENPTNAKSITRIRKELAVILYDNKLAGEKGPTRKMRVLIPDVDDLTNDQKEFKPVYDKDTLLGRYKSGSLTNMRYYHNKAPKWNPQIRAFVLNFNGRVDKPSVKNFQLIDYINEDNIYLQFGRVGDDVFNIDAQYPMSPLQAFGICISSFDYKIACE